jgi:carbamate kinase
VLEKLAISLGGNAFAGANEAMTMSSQFAFAAATLEPLSRFLDSDSQVLVTHGNGPQVGYILTLKFAWQNLKGRSVMCCNRPCIT